MKNKTGRVPSIQLSKNLRRDILRGDPWIYREALIPHDLPKMVCTVKLVDRKGEFLAWTLYDPDSVLAARVLSTQKEYPKEDYFKGLMTSAKGLRDSLIDYEKTDSFRLFNGEGDRLPGLVCDLYGAVAVLQFDGKGPEEFWDLKMILDWMKAHLTVNVVLVKGRQSSQRGVKVIHGDLANEVVEIKENSVRFLVNLVKGQKTGFFLDQRENRNYLRSFVKGKSVLNLFSYTGGFSVYAGMGGATEVASVDISQGALDLAQSSWELNGLKKEGHKLLCVDIIDYFAESGPKWDCVIVDPPSMAHSEKQRETAKEKYIEIFSAAVKKVKRGGDFFISSCSSHVTFDDFQEIALQSLGRARLTGRILRISGQGGDHPFPHVNQKMRYLKFVHIRLDQ